MTDPSTVLVTGIGGNVGQGIIRALSDCFDHLRFVGTNTEAVSGGNHLCDRVHRVPFAWENGYLAAMAAVCTAENVALVVPATDHEAWRLAAGRTLLPPVAVSSAATAETFLDKLLTARHFEDAGLPFAQTTLPRRRERSERRTIVKPRTGRGSRDIHVDPPDLGAFDDTYVAQDLIEGREITAAAYVTRTGRYHGCVALERTLWNGATVTCAVARDVEPAVDDLLRRLCSSIEVIGSCNVQLVVTEDRELVPFEVNGRLSGTASIRHRLGFPDAVWTVEEWLEGREPEAAAVIDGCATRLLTDVIYPGSTLADVAREPRPHEVF